MNNDDEIRSIMRAALERLKDEALHDMTAKGRRLVSIARGPSADEIHRQRYHARHLALTWPFGQAMLACGLLFAIFVVGLAANLSGIQINAGVSLLSISVFPLIPLSVAQIWFHAHRVQRSGAIRAQ